MSECICTMHSRLQQVSWLYSLQKLLNVARQVRPDLYVVAELYTSSQKEEDYFFRHLGINSLIKSVFFCLFNVTVSVVTVMGVFLVITVNDKSFKGENFIVYSYIV